MFHACHLMKKSLLLLLKKWGQKQARFSYAGYSYIKRLLFLLQINVCDGTAFVALVTFKRKKRRFKNI